MNEVVVGYFDEVTGELVLDAELAELMALAKTDLEQHFRDGTPFGCANPTEPQSFGEPARVETIMIRVRDYWHNSQVEGPGRRSVVRMQGCPIRCKGCWVPETWEPSEGQWMDIDTVARTLLDSTHSRDGVTILGGEPFAQPDALLALISRLRDYEPLLHITVYSGYTFQGLVKRNLRPINQVLSAIDVLIDGPYVEAMGHSADCDCTDEARRFTGSCNQKVRQLR